MEPSDSGMYPSSHQSTVSVRIDEFSTGIIRDGNKDDWFSRGFTGRYMNTVLPSIPQEVETLINNHGFAVSEGAYSNRPAIIGRTLPCYSILALVTRGKDEKGRSFGCHRYFLCEGSDKLGKILEWIEDYRNKDKHDRYPVFNPFDEEWMNPDKTLMTTSSYSKTHFGHETSWLYETPEIAPWNQGSVAEINQLAKQKAQAESLPVVSWAFDVEALEDPWNFQVIKPASKKAEDLLRSTIQTSSTRSTASVASSRTTRVLSSVTLATSLNDQEIKNTIKNLINSNRIDPKLFQSFSESLARVKKELDPAKIGHYWNRIFDVSQAYEPGMSQHPPTVRLLTLRAIAMPETLLECIKWLGIGGSEKNKGSQISLEFQSNLKHLVLQSPQPISGHTDQYEAEINQFEPDPFESLKANLDQGIKNVLLEILNFQGRRSSRNHKEMLKESMLWLLKKSLWSIRRDTLLNDFIHDFKVIGMQLQPVHSLAVQSHQINYQESAKTRESQPNPYPHSNQQEDIRLKGGEFEPVRSYIKQYWNKVPNPHIEQFILFAELLNELGASLLSACFYQIGSGSVPSSIYRDARGKRGFNNSQPFGLSLHPKRTWVENIVHFVHRILKLDAVLVVMLIIELVLIIWLVVPGVFNRTQTLQPVENSREGKDSTPPGGEYVSPNISPSQPASYVDAFDIKSVPPTVLKDAQLKINSTAQAIEQTVKALVNDQDVRQILTGYSPEEIEAEVKKQLKGALAMQNLTPDQLNQLNYSALIQKNFSSKERDTWIAAIYFYQSKRTPDNLFGYMVPKSPKDPNYSTTAYQLQEDIKAYLRILNPSSMSTHY